MNQFRLDDLTLPEHVRDLVVNHGALLAGGAVTRILVGGAWASDFDLFFADEQQDAFERACGHLLRKGWSVLPPRGPNGPDTEYLHERFIFRKDGQADLDIIWCEKWNGHDDILNGFDLSCCQVGLGARGLGLDLLATDRAVVSLMTRSFRVTHNVWPTTAARAQKYVDRGFRLVGQIPPYQPPPEPVDDTFLDAAP